MLPCLTLLYGKAKSQQHVELYLHSSSFVDRIAFINSNWSEIDLLSKKKKE